MKITQYTIKSDKIGEKISIACVADLHARDPRKTVEALKKADPDLILLAGDIFEVANRYMAKRNKNSKLFLESIKDIAPIFYCFGNHEIYYSHAKAGKNRYPDPTMNEELIESIKKHGIHLVNDSFENINIAGNTLVVGGIICGYDTDPDIDLTEPNLSNVNAIDSQEGFKILICHYPHYYEKHLKNTNLDLIVSGHAHGGHWRFFGRGVYAPHQGLFPKYTSGIHDGRLIINRGAVNNSKPIPRFFNPTEIVKITLENSRKTR